MTMADASGTVSRTKRFKRFFKGEPGNDKPKSASESTTLTITPKQSGSPAASIPEPDPNVADEDEVVDLSTARERLWKRVFEKLKEEKPDLVDVYERLIKDDAGVDQDAKISSPETITAVVNKQKDRMENKQWTYSWFGKTQKVRDSAQSILTTVQKVSGVVSAGVSLAPPYVSIPWGMTTSLIAFVMSDFEAVQSAIDGLKEVTSVLASYSYAEQEFLTNKHTKKDFEDIVLSLYVAILEYQASAAQYFARNTLKRLGCNTLTGQSWSDSLIKVRNLEQLCHTPIVSLATRLNQDGFKNVEDALGEGLRLVKQITNMIESERSQRERVQAWISPINYLQDHTELLNLIGEDYLGSGRWLLEDLTAFEPWKRSPNDILFLQGVVGSGKTSLTSMVIQDLLCEGQLAFFYCSHNALPQDPSRTVHDETENILRSILAQCAVRIDGTISEYIQTAFDKSDRKSAGGSEMTLGVIISSLKEVLEERKDEQFTFVFDALDECKDQYEFLSNLANLRQSAPNLRIFVSTRYGIDIKEHFETFRALSVGVQNSDDIQTYIEREISKRGKKMKAEQADRLKAALIQHSEGVFRWVVLELDLFFPRTQRQGARMMSKDLDRRLERLESSQAPAVDRLFEAYEDLYQFALGDEDEVSRRFVVKTAMKWVLCSFSQLTANYLQHAVSIQMDGTKDEDITIEDILDYCSNFLVRVSGNRIRLAHLSVRQFFEGKQSTEFAPPQQHLQVALTCVHIVRSFFVEGQADMSDIRRPGILDLPVLRSRLVDGGNVPNTFNVYPYLYWSIHCRLAASCERLSELLKSAEVRDVYLPNLDSIHFMIAHGQDIASQDIMGNTILHKMVKEEKLSELALLLRADQLVLRPRMIQISNKAGDLPLHLAALLGREEAFQDLLLAGSKPDQPNLHGLTATHIAVILGRDKLTRMVSRLGLDVPDSAGNNLLHYASFFDRDESVRSLIGNGYPMEVQNKDGDTPLHLAAASQSYNSIQVMTSAKAATDIRNADDKLASDILASKNFRNFDWIEHQPQKPVRDNSKLSSRPKIIIDDPEITSCEFCDLEGWLRDSENGIAADFFVSKEAKEKKVRLMERGELNCKLCVFITEFLSRRPLPLRPDGIEDVKVRALLDVDSRGLDTGKDILTIAFASTETELEFCIDEEEAESPVGGLFRGRMIKFEALENHAVQRLSSWLDACRDHESCNQSSNSNYPTRLVDVGQDPFDIRPRLVETLHFQRFSPYVFLSFAWGDLRDPFFLLKSETLEEFHNGMELAAFGAVHQEAMRLCCQLGYRYIYIDALCIIQGSQDDTVVELRRLGGYIARADLIFAATNTNVSEHLIRHRSSGVTLPIPARIRSGLEKAEHRFTLYLREPQQDVATAMQDTVLSRAWRLQEVFLARKIILFDSNQMFWTCCEALMSEASAFSLPPWFETFPSLRYRLTQYEHDLGYKQSEVFRYWHSVVEMNSRGRLAIESDRLVSVETIVQELTPILQDIDLENSYYFGIWRKDILHGLLWTSSWNTKNKVRWGWPGHSPAPSWSWANNCSAISYCLVSGLKNMQSETGLLELIDLSSSSSKLRVSALSKVTENAIDIGSYEFFFDPAESDQQPEENGNPDAHSILADNMYNIEGLTFILVAPWTFRPSFKVCDSRWAGLMLEEKEHGTYVRRGVFLGPLCDQILDDWSRKEIYIA